MECASYFECTYTLEVFAFEKQTKFRLRGFLAFPLRSLECLGCEIMTIAFTIDTSSGRPRSRHTKVTNLERAGKVDKDVGGFQIKMDDVVVMNVLQALL